ncbi:hypothetical protein PR048_002706 [Dryococelus australis]|uniref:Uncharacterized protein n=1 Tax=Dryococelus australis TaxID=614101 RepID=A0ABQ9IKX9_9NEOP|nr:hypothetical protein PR048_002706 [Dryococelus australis]
MFGQNTFCILPLAVRCIYDTVGKQSAASPYFHRAASGIRQRTEIIGPEFVGYLLPARFRPRHPARRHQSHVTFPHKHHLSLQNRLALDSLTRIQVQKVVRLLASRQGESGFIPLGSFLDFRTWEMCRMMPLVGEFSRGLPFPPSLHSGTVPADKGEAREYKEAPECEGRRKRENPEKNRLPVASSGMILILEVLDAFEAQGKRAVLNGIQADSPLHIPRERVEVKDSCYMIVAAARQGSVLNHRRAINQEPRIYYRKASLRDDNFAIHATDPVPSDRRRAAREVISGREICDYEYQAVKGAAGRLDYWIRCANSENFVQRKTQLMIQGSLHLALNVCAVVNERRGDALTRRTYAYALLFSMQNVSTRIVFFRGREQLVARPFPPGKHSGKDDKRAASNAGAASLRRVILVDSGALERSIYVARALAPPACTPGLAGRTVVRKRELERDIGTDRDGEKERERETDERGRTENITPYGSSVSLSVLCRGLPVALRPRLFHSSVRAAGRRFWTSRAAGYSACHVSEETEMLLEERGEVFVQETGIINHPSFLRPLHLKKEEQKQVVGRSLKFIIEIFLCTRVNTRDPGKSYTWLARTPTTPNRQSGKPEQPIRSRSRFLRDSRGIRGRLLIGCSSFPLCLSGVIGVLTGLVSPPPNNKRGGVVQTFELMFGRNLGLIPGPRARRTVTRRIASSFGTDKRTQQGSEVVVRSACQLPSSVTLVRSSLDLHPVSKMSGWSNTGDPETLTKVRPDMRASAQAWIITGHIRGGPLLQQLFSRG